MTYEDYQKMKWLSVYGASIAIQCHQHMMDGKGGVMPQDMKDIIDEAEAIADLALEGESK